MKGPARYGSILYARDIKRLANFYSAFFGMNIVRETPEFIALEVEGFNIIVHKPPIEMPEQNFNTVKLFFTVASLAEAKKSVADFGGKAMDGEWSNPVFKVCNIMDPEGNHIQLREFNS